VLHHLAQPHQQLVVEGVDLMGVETDNLVDLVVVETPPVHRHREDLLLVVKEMLGAPAAVMLDLDTVLAAEGVLGVMDL
jgi:hypothetical protein